MVPYFKVCDLPDYEGSLVVSTNIFEGDAHHIEILDQKIDSPELTLLHGGDNEGNPLFGACCGGRMKHISVSTHKKLLVCERCYYRYTIPESALKLIDLVLVR